MRGWRLKDVIVCGCEALGITQRIDDVSEEDVVVMQIDGQKWK